ncbi:MAG: flagellar basal body P-ring protein FlgI [Planctomycetota bacterium]
MHLLRVFFSLLWIAALALLAAVARPASATTVQEVTRIQGQGQSVLQGLGLVVGLPGTGDSGSELVVARPLMQLLQNTGNPVASVDELANSQSIALVLVTCTIPEEGGLTDDRFDVSVSVINSAQSLEGGRLFITPLAGPTPGSPVFAFAEGPIEIETPAAPTTGRVREGARMAQDVTPPEIDGSFVLVMNSHLAGFGATSEIAGAINGEYFNNPDVEAQRIARSLNSREILIEIPQVERTSPTEFIASVLSTDINPVLLRLPARVIVNRRTGGIVISGDVSISPGIVTYRGLTINTTLPTPVPTPDQPLVDRARWAEIGTGVEERQAAKLQDLLAAFGRLDIPTEHQIDILMMLEKNGQLYGKLVID